MSLFEYRWKTGDASVEVSQVEAATMDEAIDLLAQRKVDILSISEVRSQQARQETSRPARRAKGGQRVSRPKLALFTRQLATAVDAGVPLLAALRRLAVSRRNGLEGVLPSLIEHLNAGESFSQSLAHFPRAFPPIFTAVVRAGERSGALAEALEGVAHYNETYLQIRRKAVGALRYPLFVLGVIVLMVAAILWKLVPVFEGMYQGFGAKLPLPTQLLISASHAFVGNMLIILAVVLGLVAGVRVLLRTGTGGVLFSRMVLLLPVFGSIMRDSICALFCKTMALLLRNGTPIIEAANICSEVVGNPFYARSLRTISSELASGRQLSELLERTGVFPELVVQLTATGEETGRLPELLGRAAVHYEQEMSVAVDSLSQLLEPVLILVLGSVAAGVVLALYLPVFSLGSLIAGQ